MLASYVSLSGCRATPTVAVSVRAVVAGAGALPSWRQVDLQGRRRLLVHSLWTTGARQSEKDGFGSRSLTQWLRWRWFQLRLRLQRLSAEDFKLWLVLGVVAVLAATAASWLVPHLQTKLAWRRSARWVQPWRWRQTPSLFELLGGPQVWFLAALALTGLAATMGQPGHTLRRPSGRRLRRSRNISQMGLPKARGLARTEVLTASQAAEAEAVEAFTELRRAVQNGDELKATLAFEDWGEGRKPHRPLRRPELRLLLDDAASVGYQATLLRLVAGALEGTGVPLDWAPERDCSDNMGRFALDSALSVAINENRNERTALLLIDLGLKSGQGSTRGLNVGPLLRDAASHGMVRLVERLIQDCGANVDAPDPRYGFVALDRAVEAGNHAMAMRLLELGADPGAGRGLDHVLAKASPQVRVRLLQSGSNKGGFNAGANLQLSMAQLRRWIQQADVQAFTDALDRWVDAGRPSSALSREELQLLLEDAVRNCRRPRLLERVIHELERLGVAIGWEAGAGGGASMGRRPLDAALQASITEARDEDAALQLLNHGLRAGGGRAEMLNGAPLLRAAASQGMRRLVRRLVVDCNVNVNAQDPRFGSVALDRAVDAGSDEMALLLLDLGADPAAGRGVEHLMSHAGYGLRRAIKRRLSDPSRQAIQTSHPAGSPITQTEKEPHKAASLEQMRNHIREKKPQAALEALEAAPRLKPGELAVLLEEAARIGYQPQLVRSIASKLEKAVGALDWSPAQDASNFQGRLPLDAALAAAIDENTDERTALLLLDLGLGSGSGSIAHLNANPLLRSAATRCMPRVVQRLLEIGISDLNAVDPLYGSTALDRAVESGCSAAVEILRRYGADPSAGRGLSAAATQGKV